MSIKKFKNKTLYIKLINYQNDKYFNNLAKIDFTFLFSINRAYWLRQKHDNHFISLTFIVGFHQT